MNPSRIEVPDLGEIAVIPSHETPERFVVAIGTTVQGFCITDPLSSTCGRFRAQPDQDYGLSKTQVQAWWKAVQGLREDGIYDEVGHQAADHQIEAYLRR